MSVTDFGTMQPQQKMAWGHKAYEEFTEEFFFTKMLAKNGAQGIIEHVTELSKNNKGESGAFFHLHSKISGGGIVGDNRAKGRERGLEAHWQQITYDQLRNAVRNKGRLADQKSVLDFRRPTRKALAAWLAETLEEQIILTASGVSYAYNTDGSSRNTPDGQDPWTDLDYAADVTAPSANRHFRWDATLGLVAGDTTAVESADVPVYNMLPAIKAKAAMKRIPPLRINGKSYYVLLTHEETMSRLWQNSEFRTTQVAVDSRGDNAKVFQGAIVTMNGLIIHPYARVFNTAGAGSGSKWGAGGLVDGSRSLLLGRQGIAMADLGAPGWNEDKDDYQNNYGICIDKMMGLLKPQFPSSYDNGATEDFGIMCIDHSL